MYYIEGYVLHNTEATAIEMLQKRWNNTDSCTTYIQIKQNVKGFYSNKLVLRFWSV